MAGWQDYPIAEAPPIPAATAAGVAPAAAPAASQPAWMSYAVAAPEVSQGPQSSAGEPESTFPQSGVGPVDAFNNFTEQAKRAASFGLTDKVSAAVPVINTAVESGAKHVLNWLAAGRGEEIPYPDVGRDTNYSDIYHAGLQQERNAGEAYAENHPVASKIATALGTAGSIGPSAAETAAATLGGKVLQGIKGGATVGGLSGFGNANDESLTQDAISAGQGAGVGAAIGGAAPVVAEKVVQPVIDWVARKFGPGAAENQAVRVIANRMAQDAKGGGPTAQDMLDLLNAAPGKPQALVDVGGENMKALAGNIARTPGEGRQILAQFLNDRDVGAGSRLAEDVNQHVSGGPSAFETAQALMEARSNAAAPLYEQAFAANQNVQSPVIDRILNTPAGKQALADARVKMQNDMTLMGVPDKELTEQAREAGQVIPGGKGVASGLKLRTLDYVKRALDDQIGSALKGGNNDDARILIGLKNKFVNALDNADVTGQAGPNSLKPEGGLYAQARAAYSGPTQSLSAVEQGQKIFSKSPEQIQAELADLEPGDREFYKLGAADAIKQKIAKTGMAGNEAKSIVNTDWAQRQIRPLFNSEEAYQRFMNAAAAENRMFQTRYDVLGNSKTASRVAEDNANGEGGVMVPALQAVGAAATGEPMVALYGAGKLAKALLGSLTGRSPEVNAAAARLLTNPSATANQSTLARVLAAQQAPSRLPLVTVPMASLAGRAYPSLTALPFIPGSTGAGQ